MSGATPTSKNENVKHLHSHDKIHYANFSDDPAIFKRLAEKLSVSGSYGTSYIKESIMDYDKICGHDSGYLCEHRLQYILNFISENFKNKHD